MTKTIYRTVTGVRRTSRPRISAKRGPSFFTMISRLDTASATLRKLRRK